MEYPKVLIISPVSFNQVTGGGIFLRNLFSDWPTNRISVVHHDPLWDENTSTVNSFRLTNRELSFCWPFSKFLSLTSPYSLAGQAPSSIACSSIKRSLLKPLQYCVYSSLPERSKLTTQLHQFISKEKPDLIYTILGSNGLMSLIRNVLKISLMPLCIHIMDDWISSSHTHGVFAYSNRRAMTQHFSNLLSQCDQLLTISDAMSAEYFQRYRLTSISLMNAIPDPPNSRLTQETGGIFRLVYIGSVLQNAQLASIIDVMRAVQNLSNSRCNIQFHVYCNTSGYSLLAPHLGSASFIHPLPTSDTHFFDMLSTASCLLLPSNFDVNSVKHIKFSLPAKLPAYLASRTPILLYGPPGTAQSDYAIADQWAEVINQRSQRRLCSKLLSMYNNKAQPSPYVQNAYRCYLRNHRIKPNTERFRKILCSLTHA